MHTQKSRLASEEMLDILNETPHWVVRSGATVFLFIIALFAAGAWVIRYPEVLKGQAVISTEAPGSTSAQQASDSAAEAPAVTTIRDGAMSSP